jgi:hypothetical protein
MTLTRRQRRSIKRYRRWLAGAEVRRVMAVLAEPVSPWADKWQRGSDAVARKFWDLDAPIWRTCAALRGRL